MSAPAPVTLSDDSRSTRLTWWATAYVAAGGLVVAGAAAFIAAHGPFTAGYLWGALVPYFVSGVIVIARIGATHPHDRFGAANTLTLLRLVVCALLGGLAFETAVNGLRLVPAQAWMFCALAVAAMIVDGLDGYMARRDGLTSAFGGRFDMEVDALQILLLCVAAVALEKAGAWVLIGGALRYAYEVAGLVWPALRRPLPPSFRRKLISVIQGGALAALLAPIIAPPFSVVLAAGALIVLIYSFAVDVIWLAREDVRLRRATS